MIATAQREHRRIGVSYYISTESILKPLPKVQFYSPSSAILMISQKSKKEIAPLEKEAPDLMASKIQTTQPIEVTAKIPVENSVDNKLDRLEQIFLKFLETSKQDKADLVKNIEEFKITVNSRLGENSKTNSYSPQNFPETPFTNRYEDNRRSSMFFGSPPHRQQNESQIQVLQADIVYEKELKVCSLEGLQYLAKQLQLLSSKYPGRKIQTAHTTCSRSPIW